MLTETEPRAGIHATAIVDEDVVLGDDVAIGPYCIVGPNVTLGDHTILDSHVCIQRDTTVGSDCHIHHGAVLGTDPQDLKFGGEQTRLVVGDRTVIREYATLNRGTAARGRTVIGSDALLMAYSHVAHDCIIGNHVILSNAVNMGGHVEIGDWAIVGGLTAIHQFVRIGEHAFVGGASRVAKDVAPYVRAGGAPFVMAGLNSVGLRRRGFPQETRNQLKRAYRLMFKSNLNVTQALEKARAELDVVPEVERFLRFFEESERGVSL
ncbi:MAG TPA: acyl-ACP--UDP-N-acetylglucosamine O-acyltransferase [Longimicrobiales bacterium]|nr:acyl-ACP--UDP-N-acetylglucosamine O-acyltransferase [Longimicrobiales bacterium]